MRVFFFSLLGLSMALTATCQMGEAATAPQWPQFRGPGARGVDDRSALPTTWNVPRGEKVLWATPIPGLAHASPIIWGDRIYVTTAVRPGKAELKIGMYGSGDSADDKISHQWRLLALDKGTGQIVWVELAHEGVPKLQRTLRPASAIPLRPRTGRTSSPFSVPKGSSVLI